jgi:hypothetical protein
MYNIPDVIEQRENSAATWAFDNIKYNKETKKATFLCDCGKWEHLANGETLSPDPYAIPICRKCFDKFMMENKDGCTGEQI